MSKTATYIAARRIQERYEVSTSTLRNWEKEGKIEAKRTPGGKNLYNSNHINQLFGAKELSKPKFKISYARVRTEHQKGELERQVQDLRKAYPNHEIVSEIASGINWSRNKFNSLLNRAFEGIVSENVVAHQDRLYRFGFAFNVKVFQHLGVKIVVQCRD